MKKMWIGTFSTPQHMLIAQFGEAGKRRKNKRKYGILKHEIVVKIITRMVIARYDMSNIILCQNSRMR